MKLIENWGSAYKALSVVLPFLATTAALLVSMITGLQDTGLIDVNTDLFWGYALTALTFIGRVIPQGSLLLGIPAKKEE